MLSSLKRNLKNTVSRTRTQLGHWSTYGQLPRTHISQVTLGNPHYGAWTFCPTNLSTQSVVYSFGVGKDISFDMALCEQYGAQIFAFDPTPPTIEWLNRQKTPPNFHFQPYGIADYDGHAQFFAPENPNHISHSMLQKNGTHSISVEVRRLGTLMGLCGHHHIDLLKMDIEGAEYTVLDDILHEKLPVKQILVEFHDRFPTIGRKKTLATIRRLLKNNYQLFHISPTYEEFSFIHHDFIHSQG